MADNMYCGIGPVPRGKVRGTPEYCIQTNQVRYYGLKKIDKSLLKNLKGSTTDLTKEKMKLRKIQDEAKILIKEVKKLRIILDNSDAKDSQIKKSQKRLDELLVKRDALLKKLKRQQKIIKSIEDQKN